MYLPPHKQREQYQRQQILTAPPERLVQLLFDGVIRFCEQAKQAFTAEAPRIEEGHNALLRAQAILMELLHSLDREKGGAVAENLAKLHTYAFNALITANMRKDIAKIEEVQKMYRSLSDAWIEAMGQLRPAEVAPTPPATTPAATQPAPASIPAPTLRPALPTAVAPVTVTPAVVAPAAPLRPVAGLTAATYGSPLRPITAGLRPWSAAIPATEPVEPTASVSEAEASGEAVAFEEAGERLSEGMSALGETISRVQAPVAPVATMTTMRPAGSLGASLPRNAMAAYRAAATL